MVRKRGIRDSQQKEVWKKKHEAICALIRKKPGIRRLNIHNELSISRRVINKHLHSEPNIREEKRGLFWDTHYRKKRKLDELFKFLYSADLQRQQQPLGRYEIIDVDDDSILYDRLTGKRMFTVHLRLTKKKG